MHQEDHKHFPKYHLDSAKFGLYRALSCVYRDYIVVFTRSFVEIMRKYLTEAICFKAFESCLMLIIYFVYFLACPTNILMEVPIAGK